MLPAAITFAAVVALIGAAYWLFVLRLDQAESAMLRKRLTQPGDAAAAAPKTSRLLQPLQQFSSLPAVNGWLTKLSRISRSASRRCCSPRSALVRRRT